ncbi:MAG TPA: recombinase zinc beta ribbon domain-containing protein [Bacillota bacterium]
MVDWHHCRNAPRQPPRQYAGTAFWNKENHKEKGVRFNPREEWTEVENAHPALIDKDQLVPLLARKAKARRNYRFAPASVSPYLFTGTALEGMPFFTCTACGGNMIGYRNGAERWYKYVCGNARSRGTAGCAYHTIIDKEWLERSVLSELEKRYQTPKRIKEIVASVKNNMDTTAQDYHQSIKRFTDKKQDLVLQLQRLLDAVKAGMPPEVVIPETHKLRDEIAGIDDDLIRLRKAPPAATQIEEEAVEKFLSNFKTAYDAATWPERKQLVRTFIRNMEFDPEKREIRVHFYPDLAVQSICVGRGT